VGLSPLMKVRFMATCRLIAPHLEAGPEGSVAAGIAPAARAAAVVRVFRAHAAAAVRAFREHPVG
jgi:hypothetical protein